MFSLSEKTELTVEDKYKRTLQEIECLRDELGKARRSYQYLRFGVSKFKGAQHSKPMFSGYESQAFLRESKTKI